MDGNAQIHRQRQALRRTITLLFSLAYLADCAAARSFAVRALVLWILRPAADYALNIIVREAQLSGAPKLVLPAALFAPAGNAPADAQSLALCFRVLALTLAQCLARMKGLADPQFADSRLACAAQEMLQKLRWLAAAALPRPTAYWDTS